MTSTYFVLQLIIPGSWILAVIINIPNFCKQDFVEEKNPNYCIYDYDWPQKWMEKAFLLAPICVNMLCFTLMMGLYSRVIHTMCFKRDEYTQHTCEQQVWLYCPINVLCGSTEKKNLQLSRESLLFRGPVVWKTARECENIYTFKRVLKTPTNKAALEKVYLIRGTWMNYNKGLVIFVYF